MIDRVTFHVRDGIAVTGVGKIYDPAKRKTRTMAGAVIRLSEYEDTGLDPWEIRRLKAERDAAVRALEGSCHECKHYTGFHHRGKCINCRHDFYGAQGHSNWEWRGPQQEET